MGRVMQAWALIPKAVTLCQDSRPNNLCQDLGQPIVATSAPHQIL